MKIKIFIFLIILFMQFFCLQSQAIEIIYPKNNGVTINANSTFFIGNVEENSLLSVNGKLVKVYENGGFVVNVQLQAGENHFLFKSIKDEKIEVMDFIIIRPDKNFFEQKEPVIENFANRFLILQTIKKNVPLRNTDSNNAKRLTHLDENIFLFAIEKKDDFYKILLDENTFAWVFSEHVNPIEFSDKKPFTKVNQINSHEDKNYFYLKISMNKQTAYFLEEGEGTLCLKLWGTLTDLDYVKNEKIEIFQDDKLNNTQVNIKLGERLWGYECFYDNNVLILKLKKQPCIDVQRPLDGLIIALDAGHGGYDAGAIGPTGVKEKDINFDIVKKLENELKSEGVKVVLTRKDDTNVDLYERVEIAKKSDAILLLSIHANALADGADPYKKHGTSVFYYHNQAKKIASSLKNALIKDLGTKDDGTSYASFVLTRPTMPLSVLIEVAYMIHPDEYKLLLDAEFRQKVAKSLKNSLIKYFSEEETFR